MTYKVQFTEKALKSLKQLDRYQAKLILSWIQKNLEGCHDPRRHGKALVGDKAGYWRYRIGSYRLIAEISDQTVKINIINIGHRRDIYGR